MEKVTKPVKIHKHMYLTMNDRDGECGDEMLITIPETTIS